jgi:hypothetical protein
MKMTKRIAALIFLLAICSATGFSEVEPKGNTLVKIELESPAFREGDMIPPEYTCDGKDISPPLEWSGAPGGTKSLALISDDPDAPAADWVHWVVYDLPPDLTALSAAVPKMEKPPFGGTQGRTDFGDIGYGGPGPPGGTHRYFFKLYALDKALGLEAGVTKKELLKAMQGHILAEARLMGKYRRT